MSRSPSRLPELAVLALACLWSAWTLRRMWGPAPLAGWDSLGHLLKLVVLNDELLHAHRLDGWFPYWHSGFDLFQFYPPGFYDLAVVLHHGTFKALSVIGAFKAVTLIALLLPGPGLWLLAWALGWPAPARLVAGTFGLVAGSYYGGGPVGTFVVGLEPNALGIGLTSCALAALVWMWRTQPASWTASWHSAPVLCAGLALAVVVQTHALSTSFLIASGVAGTVVYAWPAASGWDRAVIRRSLAAAVWGVGLGASWWLPALAGFAQHGQLGTWVIPDLSTLWTGVWDGSLVGDAVLAFLALAGAGVLLWRRRREDVLVALWLGMALVLASGVLVRAFPIAQALSQFVRYEAYLALLAPLAAAAAVTLALRLLRDRLPGAGVAGAWALGTVLLLAWVVEVAPHHASSVDSSLHLQSDYAGTADATRMMDWLRANSPPGARILSEFSYDALANYGSAHLLDQLVPLQAHRFELGGNFPEGTPASTLGVVTAQNLANVQLFDSAAPQLRPWGVVTFLPTTAEILSPRTEFRLVAASGDVRVWQVTMPPPPGQPDLADWRWRVDHWSISVGARTAPNTWVLLPVSYHPRWSASWLGETVPTRDNGGFLAVRLPGLESGTLEMNFGADPAQLLGGALSLLFALAWVALLWWRTRVAGLADSRPATSGL